MKERMTKQRTVRWTVVAIGLVAVVSLYGQSRSSLLTTEETTFAAVVASDDSSVVAKPEAILERETTKVDWQKEEPLPHVSTVSTTEAPLVKKEPEEEKKPSGRFAYAFVISGCTRDGECLGYILNTLVATAMLRQSKSTADVVLQVRMASASTDSSLQPEHEAWLSRAGVKVRYSPKVQVDNFGVAQLEKFRVLEMIDYDRVMFLDSDILPLCNMDYMFEASMSGVLEGAVAVPGIGEPTNGGTFMVTPKEGEFERVMGFVQRHREERGTVFDKKIGWGHAIHPEDTWTNLWGRRIGNNWDFYGASVDQGLLFYYFKYNLLNWSWIPPTNKVVTWKDVTGHEDDYEKAFSVPEYNKSIALVSEQEDILPGCGGNTVGRRKSSPKVPPHSDFIHFKGDRKPWKDGIEVSKIPAASDFAPAGGSLWLQYLGIANKTFALELPSEMDFGGKSNPLGLKPSGDHILSPTVEIPKSEKQVDFAQESPSTTKDEKGAMEIAETVAQVTSNSTQHQTAPAEASSQDVAHNNEETSGSYALVPVQPYHACNGKILHLSCHKTLVFDNSLTDDIDVAPINANLAPNLCEELPSGKDAAAQVCLQTSDTLGVLVNHNRDKFVQQVPSEEAEAILKRIQENKSYSVRLVRRKVAEMSTYLGMPGYYHPRSNESDSERAKDSNRGNYMWEYGGTRMINPATTLFVDQHTINRTDISSPDALVISTANSLFLGKRWLYVNDFKRWDKQMENLPDVPTILLGIGIQPRKGTGQGAVEQAKLNPHFNKTLSTIQSRQKTPGIGVRGDLTKVVCENTGIQHCVSTGCPSLMISRDRNLGETLRKNWDRVRGKLERNETIKIALAIPARSAANGIRDLMFRVVSRIHQEQDAVFGLQEPVDEDDLAAYFGKRTDLNKTEFESRIYTNLEEWLDDVSKVDMVLSPRIHGGMSGVSTGIPTVVFPTDFRIMELVEAMKLPYMTYDELRAIPEEKLLEGILQGARNQNFTAFEENRRSKIKLWNNILQEAGLEMDPELLGILDTKL